MRIFASILCTIMFAFSAAAQARPEASPSPAPAAQIKDEPPVVTRHSANVGGRQLNYTVTTGHMPINNARTGVTEGRIFYMAYTLDGVADPSRRPPMFSFNGGPGPASIWLHPAAPGPMTAQIPADWLRPP